MRQIRKYLWKDGHQEGVLFAIQRLDELLFFYTKDTYKAPIYNVKTLVREYLDVCNKIDQNHLAEKNEIKIVEELVSRLESDKEARELIGESLCKEFVKNYKSYGRCEQRQFITLFQSSLNGGRYFALIKSNLLNAVRKTSKNEIERLLLQFVCEVKNVGYESRYIYKCLNRQLLNPKNMSFEKFEIFVDTFSGEERQYKLLIEEQRELADFCFNLAKVFKDISFSEVSYDSICKDVDKTGKDSVFILVDSITALDEYSAVENAKSLIKTFDYFYLFYKHKLNVTDSRCYVWIDDKYTYVRPEAKGIQKSIKGIKQQNLVKHAKRMFDFATEHPNNFYDLIRIMDIHNTAVRMESSSNALLSLWSIPEMLLEKENAISTGSRINQIATMMEPFLKYRYIYGLVNQFGDDFNRWNEKRFREVIGKIHEGANNIEKTYAFIVLDKYDELRRELYKELDDYPLLRYRLFSLNDSMKNNKKMKAMLEKHTEKTKWQLYRIYRARNCIIHDGENINKIEDLLENLHNYIDELCRGIIENASIRESYFSVEDSIYEMKIKNKFYMERLKQPIDENNLFDYLYF